MLNGKLSTNKLIGCFFVFVLICANFVSNNFNYNSGVLKNINLYKSTVNSDFGYQAPWPI